MTGRTGLDEVLAGASGPGIVAFFDFDGTLIEGYSGVDFYRDRLRRGQIGPVEFARSAAATLDYRVRTADITGLLTQTVQAWAGLAEQELLDPGERLFGSTIAGRVYPEARDLVAAHRNKGHTVVLATSATRYQVAPLARDLGIEEVLCSGVEVVDGVLTGRVAGPVLWGEGKAAAVRAYAVAADVDLSQCYAYGNGDEDVAFLDTVGHPRPLNPGPGLARVAAERGWPVRHLRGRGRARPLDVVRTGAALGSLAASLGIGVGVGVLTGSRRTAANLLASIGGDLALALAGITVEIADEQNLWAARPAVFVFNHQSALDVVIMARLLRQDFTGVVKKESSRDPLFAPLGMLMDVAYVERGNRDQTRAALEPVLQRLAAGVSVAIAPEGTRSSTRALGPFKKGAFHMALRAGVPMVPVVIHNASDLMWKKSLVIRPGVLRVEVLPPVPTGGWDPADLDRHVDGVREMFLETLRRR